jgi:hypothetical protein
MRFTIEVTNKLTARVLHDGLEIYRCDCWGGEFTHEGQMYVVCSPDDPRNYGSFRVYRLEAASEAV